MPIAWICGNTSVPDKMKVMGANATNLLPSHLSIDCRGSSRVVRGRRRISGTLTIALFIQAITTRKSL
jgi:hypothetical protein